VFYLGCAQAVTVARALDRAKCADMFQLADIVRELYAIKKYVDPLPAGLNSKMVKFIITRIFNTLEYDAESEIDIDDLWSVLVDTISTQPKFSGSEFVAVLDYLGLWAGETGKIKGYKVKEGARHWDNFELFVRRTCDPSEKIFSLIQAIGNRQGELNCPRKTVSRFNQSSAI
jgi:hypothetical protein